MITHGTNERRPKYMRLLGQMVRGKVRVRVREYAFPYFPVFYKIWFLIVGSCMMSCKLGFFVANGVL